MKEYYQNLLRKIDTLTVYKNIANNDIVMLIKKISLNIINNKSNDQVISTLIIKLIESAEENGYKGNLLKNYIINLFITDENIFTLYCENNAEVKHSTLYNLALNDIETMRLLALFDISVIS